MSTSVVIDSVVERLAGHRTLGSAPRRELEWLAAHGEIRHFAVGENLAPRNVQPTVMLVPQVVGFRLTGALPEGATATDLVLTVTQVLRGTGVVGKFVEYFGHGLETLPLADRATIGNMSPEYGATCGFFPVDAETLRYLRLTGRSEERIALVEAYCKENALWHEADDPPTYSQVVELDLSTVEPSLAGPRRPQDRVPLTSAKHAFIDALPSFGVDYGNSHDEAVAETFPASDPLASGTPGHAEEDPADGAISTGPRLVLAEQIGRAHV